MQKSTTDLVPMIRQGGSAALVGKRCGARARLAAPASRHPLQSFVRCQLREFAQPFEADAVPPLATAALGRKGRPRGGGRHGRMPLICRRCATSSRASGRAVCCLKAIRSSMAATRTGGPAMSSGEARAQGSCGSSGGNSSTSSVSRQREGRAGRRFARGGCGASREGWRCHAMW